MTNKIIYTNTNMRGDLQEIIRQMTTSGFTPEIVVGIARGGLVPATMLSHYFGIPLQTINYSLRDQKVSQASELNDVARLILAERKVLLVDDICDGGDTLRNILDKLTELYVNERPDSQNAMGEFDRTWVPFDNCKTAVLWNNTAQELVDPDFYGKEIDRNEDSRWVIFPYEEWWKS